MRERILVISWGVPPLPSGSAVIIGNLAKQFAAHEMIVAGEWPYHKPRVSWRQEWPRLAYIASELPANWRGSRWWRRLQLPLMVWRSISLVKQNNCSVILAVFPNEEFLLVAYLTAVYTKLPLLAYFHNTYVENRRGVSLKFARWLQTRVFMRAKHVFVMSQGMVELYREKYPKLECSSLVHSFNEDVPVFKPLAKIHSPLRLIMCGNINESCRDAAVRFCEAVAGMKNVTLTFLSGTPRAALEELGLLRNGNRCETISRDSVVSRLQQADIVVLPHGFTGKSSPEEYRTMFPTKTIEYLISERPILAHAPANCYLTRFLKKHNCALVVETPSTQAIIEAVKRLRNNSELRSNLVRSALQTAEMFHAPQVAETLRSQLQGNGNDGRG